MEHGGQQREGEGHIWEMKVQCELDFKNSSLLKREEEDVCSKGLISILLFP